MSWVERLRDHGLAIIVAACGVVSAPHRGLADDVPEHAQNGDPQAVRDVAVYLLSTYGTQLNERGLFDSTLPGYTLSRRPIAARDQANTPTPAGIITFSGRPEPDVDVLLEFDSGRFLTHWPPGRMRSKRLLWASIDIADESTIAPASMPEAHWLLPMREVDRLFTIGNKQADRFLLYDAELPYAPHVTLARAEDGYTVTNTGKFPVHDVVVYRSVGDGQWEMAEASIVEAASKNEDEDAANESEAAEAGDDQPQPVAPATESPASAASPFAEAPAAAEPSPFAEPAGAAPTTDVASGAESAAPKEDEKKPVGATARASIVGSVTADDALQAWRTSLAALNLEAPEIEFVTGILRQQALRTESAMLVYRLDEAQLEKMLPLEVTPYPDRLFRVALVIVQDADPDLQSEIESLVAQLGNDDWRTREAAQKELTELGLAAKPKLETALKNEDAEIVFRAEQLLEALKAAP